MPRHFHFLKIKRIIQLPVAHKYGVLDLTLLTQIALILCILPIRTFLRRTGLTTKQLATAIYLEQIDFQLYVVNTNKREDKCIPNEQMAYTIGQFSNVL